MPMAPATRKAPAAAGAERSVGHCARCAMSRVAAMPRTMPAAPPTRLSAVSSTRNWNRMCPLRAPTASRTPISRVRSVTETSMMFMMPMPPTRSDTEATLRRRFIITTLAFFEASAISLRSRTVKSSSWPGGQERDQDDVVLILAPRRLPLAGEDADHLEGHVLHADDGADRILARCEELIDDRLPEDRHWIGACLVPLLEEPTRAE